MQQQSYMSTPNSLMQQLCEKEEKKQNELFNKAMAFYPYPLYGNNNPAIGGPTRSDVLRQKMLLSLPLSPTNASSSMTGEICTPVLYGLAEKKLGSLSAKDALSAVLEPIPINENNMTVLQGDIANNLLLDSLKQQLSGVLEGERPIATRTKQTKRPAASSDQPQRPSKKACNRNLELDTVPRFRCYQTGQWSIRFDALLQFKEDRGHCCVPHGFSENPVLARWVKRQRYQYKLKMEIKPSTMTSERIAALEEVGFVWDSHGAAWMERINELQDYAEKFGSCDISTGYQNSYSPKSPKLASWVKCQRRQYKMYEEGKPSNMTPQRISALENIAGFEWETHLQQQQLQRVVSSANKEQRNR